MPKNISRLFLGKSHSSDKINEKRGMSTIVSPTRCHYLEENKPLKKEQAHSSQKAKTLAKKRYRSVPSNLSRQAAEDEIIPINKTRHSLQPLSSLESNKDLLAKCNTEVHKTVIADSTVPHHDSFRKTVIKTFSSRISKQKKSDKQNTNTNTTAKKPTSPRRCYNKQTPQVLVLAEKEYIASQQDDLTKMIIKIMKEKDVLSLYRLEADEAFSKTIENIKIGYLEMKENFELKTLRQYYQLNKSTTNQLMSAANIFKKILAECKQPIEMIDFEQEVEKYDQISALIQRLILLKTAMIKIPAYNKQDINQSIGKIIAYYQDFISQLDNINPKKRHKLLRQKVKVFNPEIGPYFLSINKAKKLLGLASDVIPGRNIVVFDKGLYWKSDMTAQGCGSLEQIEPWMEYDFSIFLRFLFGKLKHPIAAPTTFIYVNPQKIPLEPMSNGKVASSSKCSQARIIQVGLGVGQFDLEDILNIMQYVHYLVDKIGEIKAHYVMNICTKSARRQLSMAAKKHDFKRERAAILKQFKNFISKQEESAKDLKILREDIQGYLRSPDRLNQLIQAQGTEPLFTLLDIITRYPILAKNKHFDELCGIPRYLSQIQSVLPNLKCNLARIQDVLTWNKKIDHKSFSALAIGMMLALAGDCHAKNIRVITEGDALGRIRKLYFCSIDNDKVLVDPLLKDSFGQHLLYTKCILYCMNEQMNQPINSHIKDIFLQTMPEKFLNKWFSLLQQRDKQCQNMAEKLNILDEKSVLPNEFYNQKFNGRDIKKLYFRYFTMHEYLKNNPEATLQELLKQVNPIVANVYSRSFDELLALKKPNVRLLTKKCHSLDRLFLLFKVTIEEMYDLENDRKKDIFSGSKKEQKEEDKTTGDEKKAQMKDWLDQYDVDVANKLQTKSKEMCTSDLATNFDIPENTYITKEYVARGLAPGGTGLFLSSKSPLRTLSLRTVSKQPTLIKFSMMDKNEMERETERKKRSNSVNFSVTSKR